MTLPTRRDVLAGLSALSVATLASPSILRAVAPLALYGPPAAPSAVLAHAVKGGFLKDVAPAAVFRAWKTPDEMRAAVASGSMGAVVMPSYAAANLHNRGLGLGLLNVLTTGLLYVVSKDESLKTVASLKGRTLALPFKNDMPDFVMARLLAKAGLGQGDVTLEYTASPPEAALADALADPAAAADAVADALGFPPDIIAASFPTSHLSAIPARAARETLEGFYGVLAKANPAIIGGKLPGDGFYLV